MCVQNRIYRRQVTIFSPAWGNPNGPWTSFEALPTDNSDSGKCRSYPCIDASRQGGNHRQNLYNHACRSSWIGVAGYSLYPSADVCLRFRSQPPTVNSFGPIRLMIKLPGTHAGIPEPLVACGKPGNSELGIYSVIAGCSCAGGSRLWGRGAVESEPFSVGKADAVIQIACFFPALFPPEGDAFWANLSPELKKIRRGSVSLQVDGVVRATAPVDYDQPPHPDIFFGENPVGGSYVADKFSGTIINATQG